MKTDPVLRINDEPVSYEICTHCGFTFKSPRFHVDAQAEKHQYDQHQNSFDNDGYVTMFKRFIAEAIDPFIKQGTALDYGSGPGPVLYELLKQKGFETLHYDPYYHPDHTVLNTRYDLITATEVFEHFNHPSDAIKTLVDRLKPGGILAVMTSIRPPDDTVFLDWWYRRDPTHVAFYTEKAFEVLSEKHQLKLKYTNHKNGFVFQKGA